MPTTCRRKGEMYVPGGTVLGPLITTISKAIEYRRPIKGVKPPHDIIAERVALREWRLAHGLDIWSGEPLSQYTIDFLAEQSDEMAAVWEANGVIPPREPKPPKRRRRAKTC